MSEAAPPLPSFDESNPARASRAAVIALLAVLLLSVAIRAWLFVDSRARNPTWTTPVADCAYYDEWALRAAHGESYGAAPFYEPPLYPHFLAGLYWIVDRFGAIERRYDVAGIVQLALGLASLVLLFRIARKVFGEHGDWVGVVAALLLTLYPSQVYFESKLLANVLETFLLLLAFDLLLDANGRRGRLAIGGLVIGLLCTARADKLLLLVLATAWVAWAAGRGRGRLVAAAAFALPAVICVGAVTARNAIVAGDPVLVAANGGVNFWFGNQDRATGVNSPPGQEFGALATQREAARKIARTETKNPSIRDSEVSSFFFAKGVDYIRERFSAWRRLFVKKLLLFASNWEFDVGWLAIAEQRETRVLAYLPVEFAPIFGLGIAGMILALRRSPRPWLLLGPLACSTVVLLAFFVSTRFRLASVPMLALFAGAAVVFVLTRIRRGRVLSALGVLVLAAGPAAWSWANERTVMSGEGELARRPLADTLYANASTIVGNAFIDQGRLDEAEAVFRDVLARDPFAFKAHLALGLISHRRARAITGTTEVELAARRAAIAEARAEFELTLESVPQFAEARAALGFLLMEDDVAEYTRAVREFQMAVRFDPRSLQLRAQLAKALFFDGRVAEARRELENVRKIAPGDPLVAELERLIGR